MFREMRVGDVVIMTPFDHYDPLLIGEVESDWSEDQVMTLPDYGDNYLPYRKVNWLSHGLSRRDFPAPVAKRMQNRKAISQIHYDYYDSIFRLVYHAYIWGETSKLDVFAPEYNSSDPTANAEASFIIKYAVALYSAIQKNEIEKFNAMSIEDAADIYFDPVLVIQIAQAFGSPGGYIVRLIGAGAAGVLAIIAAIALSDESKSIDAVKVEAVQQAQVSIPIPPGVDAVNWNLIGNSIRAGNGDQLRERYGRAAKAKLGLTLTAHLSPDVTVRDRIIEQ
jgi:hypothetical protein